MSVRYTTLSRTSIERGPKSSSPTPWFRRRANALSSNNYTGISMSPGAVANTKTAWTQVTASTSERIGQIRLRMYSNYALVAAQSTLVDIGIGAAGSETVIIANLALGCATNIYGGIVIDIPINIPSGTRVAIRTQSQRTSYTYGINVILIGSSDPQTTPSSVDVLGTSTANSGNTAMSGASGTYVQIIAATTKDYQSLIVVPSLAPSAGLSGSITITYTVAVGAAGSEVDITQSVLYFEAGNGSSNIMLPPDNRGGILVRAGSRISVKHNIASGPSNYGACVIGVPYV